ncbi:MAG TPA: lmo0937 family membrane protein [Gemmatimonadales bacterium]
MALTLLRKEDLMLFTLAVILLVAWLLGFTVFHVAGGLIHILLVVAVIAVLWHFIGGRRTSA